MSETGDGGVAAARPAGAPGADASRRLVVLGDSLAFHGPEGPLPVADPRLYPNRVAALLGARTHSPWHTVLVARAGLSVRDVRFALAKDVHLQQQVVAGADAVVFAVGSADTLSVGMPRAVVAVLPYLRPPALRRRIRAALNRHHARLVRASRGRVRFTPPAAYREAWRLCLDGLRWLAPDAACCAVLPATHRAPHYAQLHPFHAEGMRATRELAAAAGVPVVDLAALMAPHLAELNPDGVHWPFAVHEAVAAAMVEALLPQLGTQCPRALPASSAAPTARE